MNNTVRIALAVAYAAVGIWALMPTPPKPLAAATSPPPWYQLPPPAYEQQPYRRQRPEPPPIPRDMESPDTYRGSADETAKPIPAALTTGPARYAGGAGFYATGLKVEMDAADLAALAKLTFKELPPEKYDVAIHTSVEVIDVKSRDELHKICGHVGVNILGCALVGTMICRVYLLDPMPAGLTRNIVLRHELGHCAGWPADHPGIR